MNYRIINIKEDMPSSEYALELMIKEIDIAKFMGIPVVVVIHGYGSHGKGGLIKVKVEETLSKLKHFGKIEEYVLGHNWSEENSVCQEIIKRCPDIEIVQNLYLKNSGVSVILVSKN